jgi:hypothetical protein
MRFISGVAHIFMPRAFRKNLFERLRIPWRFPAGVIFTLPVPVRRKRFFTLLFVFNLGILSLFSNLNINCTAAKACPGTLPQPRCYNLYRWFLGINQENFKELNSKLIATSVENQQCLNFLGSLQLKN